MVLGDGDVRFVLPKNGGRRDNAGQPFCRRRKPIIFSPLSARVVRGGFPSPWAPRLVDELPGCPGLAARPTFAGSGIRPQGSGFSRSLSRCETRERNARRGRHRKQGGLPPCARKPNQRRSPKVHAVVWNCVYGKYVVDRCSAEPKRSRAHAVYVGTGNAHSLSLLFWCRDPFPDGCPPRPAPWVGGIDKTNNGHYATYLST